MSRIIVLVRRVSTLQQKVRPARHHTFLLEEGKDLSPEQKALIKPGDSVVIRLYPAGYGILESA